VDVYEELFGQGSEQHKQCEEDLHQFDTAQLKEETNKYIQFLLQCTGLDLEHCCQLAEFWAAGLKNGPVKLLAA
jgi:hypothetical protein